MFQSIPCVARMEITSVIKSKVMFYSISQKIVKIFFLKYCLHLKDVVTFCFGTRFKTKVFNIQKIYIYGYYHLLSPTFQHFYNNFLMF